MINTGYKPVNAWCRLRKDEYRLRVWCVLKSVSLVLEHWSSGAYTQLYHIGDVARFASFGSLECIDDTDLFSLRNISIFVAAGSFFRFWSHEPVSQFRTLGSFGWIWETSPVSRRWGAGCSRKY